MLRVLSLFRYVVIASCRSLVRSFFLSLFRSLFLEWFV